MRRRAAGFSLLEVMVAMAILSLAVVVLIRITTGNVRAAAHARLTTTATFLARAKLAAMEDGIVADGFTDSDEEDQGDFGDEGYPQFRWSSIIERVELPTDAAQKAQEAAAQQTQEATTGTSSNPMMALAGVMGGFMSTLIEPIRVGLQESVRRITVTVRWNEVGRDEQSFDVVAYLTDPAKLDLAMGAPPGGAAGAGGGTGAGGAGGSTGGRGGSSGGQGAGGSSGTQRPPVAPGTGQGGPGRPPR
jgi:general secretion pathway protein I